MENLEILGNLKSHGSLQKSLKTYMDVELF